VADISTAHLQEMLDELEHGNRGWDLVGASFVSLASDLAREVLGLRASIGEMSVEMRRLSTAVDTADQAEARIVAWLRGQWNSAGSWGCTSGGIGALADAIERGEHDPDRGEE